MFLSIYIFYFHFSVTSMKHKKNSVRMPKKVRQYSDEYLLFGFIPATHDERLPSSVVPPMFD